jgi:hypothetical protein
MELRCWQCGVEPTGLAEVTLMEDPEPRYLPTGWPTGDHQHDLVAPTAGQLAAAGDAARQRMLRIAAE